MECAVLKICLTIGPSMLGQLPPDDLSHGGRTVAFILGNGLQAIHVDISTLFYTLETFSDVFSISQLTNVESKSSQDWKEGGGGIGHPVGQDGMPAMYRTQKPGVS